MINTNRGQTSAPPVPIRDRFYGSTARTAQVEGIRLTESAYPAGMSLPRHAHEHPHFCLVLTGSYDERVHERDLLRRPLTLTYYPAFVPHEERHHGHGRHLLIEIDRSWLRRQPQSLGDRMRAVSMFSETSFRAAFALCNVTDGRGPTSSDTVKRAVGALIDAASQRRDTGVQNHHPRWLSDIRRLLEQGRGDPPSLSDLASRAGVHPCHLTRAFRRAFGCTIGRYLALLRSRQAYERIVDSDLSFAHVAVDSGFADQSHLCREVKRITGRTPGELRRLTHP